MIKKTLFFCIIFLIFIQLIHAQEKAFQFGFKAAPNLGWIKPNAEGYVGDGVKMGFTWGFIGDIHLMENYWMNTGFNVIFLQGAYHYPHQIPETDGSSSYIVGTLNRSLSTKYIQVPIVFRMKTEESNSLCFYGEIGFGLGFLIDAKASDSFYEDGVLIEETTKANVSNEYRLTRESLILGAGIEYSLGTSNKLTTGLRFDNNFFDILKDQNTVDSSIEQKAISNFIELQVCFLF
jgi:hypothetical protein